MNSAPQLTRTLLIELAPEQCFDGLVHVHIVVRERHLDVRLGPVGVFPMSNRSPCSSTPLIGGSLRIASVSWSTPPPGSVDSSRSKISDVGTYRPVIARFEGA